MGGILKNPIPEEESPNIEGDSISQFRQQVLKNTELNAQLTANKTSHHPHGIPKDTLSLKLQENDPDRLKWNQQNLEENEVTKLQYQDIHVDEPKTPYQGAVDPSGEYYKVDDEDDLENFTLGEPQVELKDDFESVDLLETGNKASSGSTDDSHLGDSENSDCEESARHKKFEEMRKKHYNVREVFKTRNFADEDEDEENN